MWDSQISNWSGSKYGDKTDSNSLIGSSAKWAGLDGGQGGDTLKLVQSLVGDTVISHGQVSVSYGDKPFGITPRTHLAGIERDVAGKLCSDLMGKIDNAGSGNVNAVIRQADLSSITGAQNQVLLDRQTLANLSVMPIKARALYCNRLANAIAVARFSEQMNRSLDVLSIASQNPNLPDRRRKEISDKRESLKESIDATIELQKERNSPLNQVVAQINDEGDAIHQELSNDRISSDGSAFRYESARKQYFDCSDGVMCDGKQR